MRVKKERLISILSQPDMSMMGQIGRGEYKQISSATKCD